MSDAAAVPADHAIALLEFDSIAVGIVAGDAMVKASPVTAVYTGTVHPGRYLVLVRGDTASVEEALAAGRAAGASALRDEMFLPDAHPSVTTAMVDAVDAARFTGEALGIVETASVPAVVEAADAGVKAAQVDLIAVRLADGLGGKGYALFSGGLSDVEAATAAASDRVAGGGRLLEHRVVAMLHAEMAENLAGELRFNGRLQERPGEGG